MRYPTSLKLSLLAVIGAVALIVTVIALRSSPEGQPRGAADRAARRTAIDVQGQVRIERVCITGNSADPICAPKAPGGTKVVARVVEDKSPSSLAGAAPIRGRAGAEGGFALPLPEGTWVLKALGPGDCHGVELTVTRGSDPGTVDLSCSVALPAVARPQLPY